MMMTKTSLLLREVQNIRLNDAHTHTHTHTNKQTLTKLTCLDPGKICPLGLNVADTIRGLSGSFTSNEVVREEK